MRLPPTVQGLYPLDICSEIDRTVLARLYEQQSLMGVFPIKNGNRDRLKDCTELVDDPISQSLILIPPSRDAKDG